MRQTNIFSKTNIQTYLTSIKIIKIEVKLLFNIYMPDPAFISYKHLIEFFSRKK